MSRTPFGWSIFNARQQALQIPDGEWELARAIEVLRAAIKVTPATAGVTDQSRSRQGFQDFVRLCEFAFKNREKRQRKSAEARGVTEVPIPGERSEDPPSSVSVSAAYEESPSAETIRSRQASAAPLREGISRLSAKVTIPVHVRQSSREAIRQAATRARLIVSDSQKLPYASNRLQLVDLQAFFRWTSQLDLKRTPGAEDSDWRIAMGILAVLSGRNGKTILNTKVVPRLPSEEELRKSTHRGILIVLEPATLILTNPIPAERFVPKSRETEFYEPILPAILIPLPTSLPGVKGLLALARQHQNAMFPNKWIWHGYREEVLELAKRARLQFTPLRLAAISSRLIVDVNHDRADGAFFSREDYVDGCAARLYYYAPKMAGLVHQYVEMWNKYQAAALPEAPKDSGAAKIPAAKTTWSWTTIPSPYTNCRVGSAGCPRIGHVKRFVTELQDALRKERSKTGRRTAQDLIKLHNLLTAYSIHMVLWTVGVRAIREPIEIQLLDLEEGFVGISDKDGDEYADARAIWLPELVRQQMVKLDEHRRLILSSELLTFSKPPTGWLFFLDAQKRSSNASGHGPGEALGVTPAQARPETLRSHCGHLYPFRYNSQRHFVRTYLRDLGVPGSDVDALLGHGSIGERPYAKYSCYSPMKLQRASQKAMEQLISMVGWEVHHGLIDEKSWREWHRSRQKRQAGRGKVV